MSEYGILKDNNPLKGPSFSLRNRIGRVLWETAALLFFRFSPRTFHQWRCFLLRCFGASIGKGCHIYPRVRIWAPWNLYMEDGSAMGNDVICYSMAPIRLGKKVVVSQGSHLCTGSHDFTHPHFPLFARPIVVGDNAWLCAESFIGPGVTIGEGAVIGARAVVCKDMPGWVVSAGNPCKPLKPRIIKERR